MGWRGSRSQRAAEPARTGLAAPAGPGLPGPRGTSFTTPREAVQVGFPIAGHTYVTQERSMSSGPRRRRPGAATTPPVQASPRTVFYLPLALTLGLVALALLPRVLANPLLTWSFFGAAGVLLVWQATLFLRLQRAAVGRRLEIVLRPQHYVQALVQLAVFAYWGWYWRPVYDMAGLIVAQLVFAYAFDMLLAWSRRERYVLGFGPFPIIFSINLFLWFRDDWFYLQFLMIAVGFLGKELIRWHREGKRTHVFNPSALSLGLFALVLVVTGATDMTRGPEIASTLTLAPRIYSYLFLTGLVAMYFFSITLVAGSAAAMLFGLSALYMAITGVPYFVDSEIPAAVFLGLHLLVTDPSTSPRTPLGKAIFGALYGVGVFGLYALLGALGAPTFYDKLLCVPLLNLSVRWIDRLAGAVVAVGVTGAGGPAAPASVGADARPRSARLLGGRLAGPSPARTNLALMVVWIVFFSAMTAMGKTDGRHPGDSLPFWERACAEDRRGACDRLLQIEASYCGDNSAWACNELGGHYARGAITAPDPELALGYFSRACELRFQAACFNLLDPGTFSRTDPRPLDLRLLLREAGRNLMEMPEPELYERACEHRWAFACERVASAS